MNNPIHLAGIEFVEFASQNPEALHQLFLEFGFSRTMRHKTKACDLYRQGDITFLLNRDPKSFAANFEAKHGPCVSSMAWRVKVSPSEATTLAVSRGARPAAGDYALNGEALPGIYGIGESLLYFIQTSTERTADSQKKLYESLGFVALETPDLVPSKGFLAIDHLTNNVEKGTMKEWSDFYKDVFGFEEIRYFDIRGAKTGLTSYALKSPCETFCIPINEATEKKSQINEYLEEYKGPGVQHIALLTENLVASLQSMDGSSKISFLDMDKQYYEELWPRFGHVKEDHSEIEKRHVLVDGDEHGYLLQIFTKNIVGPIFIELIQRNNHYSFGEGNFGALFRSIERDQMKRGYLD